MPPLEVISVETEERMATETFGKNQPGYNYEEHTYSRLTVDFTVKTNVPSEVIVDYKASGVPNIRSIPTATISEEEGNFARFSIVRLRANTEYSFKVRARGVGGGGGSSRPFKGTFQTGPLPLELAFMGIKMLQGPSTSPLIMMDQYGIEYPYRVFGDELDDVTEESNVIDWTYTWNGYACMDSEGYIVWYYCVSRGHNEDEGNHSDCPHLPSVDGGPSEEWIDPATDKPGAFAQTPDLNMVVARGGGIKSPNRNMWLIDPNPPLGFNQKTYGVLKPSEYICSADDENGGIHHEIYALEDRNVLYLGREFNYEKNYAGDTIRNWTPFPPPDLDPNFEPDKKLWATSDVLDPEQDKHDGSGSLKTCKSDPSGPIELWNWTHTNAMAPGSDENYVMSTRLFDAIISVRQDDGALQWVLGGFNTELVTVPASKWISFEDENDRFYHQHSVRQLGNWKILLFDNGQTGPNDGKFSRAMEFQLDLDNMTARKVWQYRNTPDVYSRIISSVFEIIDSPTDNKLICFGSSSPKIIVEARGDMDDVSVAKFEISGKKYQYRAYPLKTITGEELLD